jgi:lipoate-protein ligase A
MFNYEYWGLNDLSISENMALEELMLEESASRNIAGIRFWNVKKDSVVLGYGESPKNVKGGDASFDLARRITGGSHVEFDKACLAYTFTVPRDGSFRHYEDMRKYFAERVTSALSDLGIKDVYADNKASTINVDEKVMASHAIFWGVKSALLHGLLLIDHYDVDRIAERMILSKRKIGGSIYDEADALRLAPAASELIKAGASIPQKAKADFAKMAISEKLLDSITGGNHSKLFVSENTLSRAERLVSSTHTDSRWLNLRNPPYTEDAAEAIPGEELNGVLKEGLGYCMYIEVSDKDFKGMAVPKEEQ